MNAIISFIVLNWATIVSLYIIGAIAFTLFAVIWCHFYNKSVKDAKRPYLYTVEGALKEGLKVSWLSWLGFIIWSFSHAYFKLSKSWSKIKSATI